MQWFRSKYVFDDTDAIYCTDDNGTPEAVLTVNLSEYGFTPPKDCVVVQTHKVSDELYELFKKELVETEIRKIPYGYCEGMLVKLKNNWKTLCRKVG